MNLLTTIRRSDWYKWLSLRPSLRYLLNLTTCSVKFGWRRGFTLANQLWSNHPDLVSIDIPGTDKSVTLRSKSSDAISFEEVFVREIYGCGLPEQAKFIIDAGANIGLVTVFFKNHFPTAQVVAVEPNPDNLSLLEANISRLSAVEILKAGIWTSNSPLKLVQPAADADYWNCHVEPSAPGEADFQGVSIEEIMKKHQVTTIDVIKLDIEGAEENLFFDVEPTWLLSVRVMLIELHGELALAQFERVTQRLAQFGMELKHRGDVFCWVRPS